MNRQILVGMVSMVLTGCAQTWPVAPPVARSSSRLPPVELSPLPNIYEALNRENPRLDPASLHPENGPVLAGMGAVPGAGGGSRGVQAGAENPAPCVACRPDPAFTRAPGPAAAPAPVAALPVNQPVHMRGAAPGPALASAPGSPLAPTAADASGVAASPVPAPMPVPGPDAAPASAPLSAVAGQAEAEVTQTSAVTGDAGAESRPAPVAVPDPSLSLPPEPVTAPEPSPAPLPAAESPVPSLPPATEGTTAGAESGPAAPAPVEPPPASAPLPLELSPLPPPEAEAKGPPEAVPAPAAPPAAGAKVPDSTAAPAPGAAAASRETAKTDPQVIATAADPAALHAEGTPVKLTEAGHIAARVGDEVITFSELLASVKERMEKATGGGYKPKPQEVMMLTSQVLDMLIERSIIVQEAKRELKKPEQIRLFYSIADKAWYDEELPPLKRQYHVENEFKLKAALEEKGKSLERMREIYRQEFLAQGYVRQKLSGKITVTVPEMREYYNAHLNDYLKHEQWTWREVIVELDKHPSRAEARGKAEAVLARLRRGDDFAKVAQTESEGPNRTQGGLWETAPDSYAVEAVNDALKSMPIGQVSSIIEGPASYHIVRVDARRPAGPASFAEVQDKIRKIIFRHRAEHEQNAFLDKLRKRTVVWTIYDRTDFPPTASRSGPTADPAVTPASATISSPSR